VETHQPALTSRGGLISLGEGHNIGDEGGRVAGPMRGMPSRRDLGVSIYELMLRPQPLGFPPWREDPSCEVLVGLRWLWQPLLTLVGCCSQPVARSNMLCLGANRREISTNKALPIGSRGSPNSKLWMVFDVCDWGGANIGLSLAHQAHLIHTASTSARLLTLVEGQQLFQC
jgi:hypothetical protein